MPTVRLALLLATFAALLAAPPAGARVALLATGGGDVALLDVATGKLVRRVPLPGPSTAVAVTPDGRVGYAAGGGAVLALDLRAPSVIGPSTTAVAPGGGTAAGSVPTTLATATVGPRALEAGQIAGLAVSPGGGTLFVAAGRRLVALDARTLQPTGSVDLRGDALALAIAPGGGLAAVPLRGGRVAMVDLGGPQLLRRVKVKGAAGAAFAAGRAWISTTSGRLRTIPPGAKK